MAPQIFLLLLIHWIADFICQPTLLANTKYKNFSSLLSHILIYFYMSFYLSIALLSLPLSFITYFVAFNAAAHLVIDYFTSKVSHYYADKKNWYPFFCVIGFDQFLHTSLLVGSFVYCVEMGMLQT